MANSRPQQRTPSPSPRMFRSRSTTSPSTRTSIHDQPKHSDSQLVGKSKSTRISTSTNYTMSNSKLMSQRSPSPYSSISSSGNSVKTNKAAASSGSKSAWALSPGRSFTPPPPDHSKMKQTTAVATKSTKTVHGGVTGVFKYFKSKKPNPKEKEDFHNLKILHNRLVQWRFTNAKAEAAMTSVKVQAENRLLSVWLQIWNVRNIMMEKRIWLQRYQHRSKLLEIVNPQFGLLEEWMQIEKRNFEALSRMTRKLTAISVQLPLVFGAEGDAETVYDSMRLAMDILESFEEWIPEVLGQVEMTYRLLEALIITAEQQRECVEEMSHWIANVSSLEVAERSSKLCLIQNIEEALH